MDRYGITQGKEPPEDPRSLVDKELWDLQHGVPDAKVNLTDRQASELLFGYSQEARDTLDKKFGKMSGDTPPSSFANLKVTINPEYSGKGKKFIVTEANPVEKEEFIDKPKNSRYKLIQQEVQAKKPVKEVPKKSKPLLRKILWRDD